MCERPDFYTFTHITYSCYLHKPSKSKDGSEEAICDENVSHQTLFTLDEWHMFNNCCKTCHSSLQQCIHIPFNNQCKHQLQLSIITYPLYSTCPWFLLDRSVRGIQTARREKKQVQTQKKIQTLPWKTCPRVAGSQVTFTWLCFLLKQRGCGAW